MRTRLRDGANDEGTSLIEVMAAIMVSSILLGITISGYASWAAARAHTGASDRVIAVMRLAHERAVTEGVSHCVDFNTTNNTYRVFRYACDDPLRQVVNGPFSVDSNKVRIAAPSFIDSGGTPRTGVTFRPTGSAWAGTVQIIRTDRPLKVYKVEVEGFTGRVAES